MAAMRFGIALRPQERPVKLPSEVQRTLRDEFHAKYLESIGATPTAANLHTARRALPINKCKLTTAWKSHGSVSDVIYIAPESHAAAAKQRHEKAPRPTMSSAEDLEKLLLASVGQQKVESLASGEEEEREEELQLGAPKGGMSFEDAKQSFLYPYRAHDFAAAAEKDFAASAPPPRTGKVRTDVWGAAQRGGSGDEASSSSEREATADKARFRSRDSGRYEQYTPEEIRAELSTILNLHTKDIVQLQQQFLRRFPFDSLEGRLSDKELKLAREELLSRPTTRFIGLLTLLLFWTHLAPRVGRQIEDEAQLAALFCSVQQYFADVRHRMLKRKAMLLFVLPLLLLLVRVSVEALFRLGFPKWWTTLDAREALREIDDCVESLFDPNAYHSHISALESSTHAIRLSAKEARHVGAHSQAGGTRRARYIATSAMVRSALPHSTLVRSHGHLSKGGGTLPSLAAKLPLDAKQQLYQAALGCTALKEARAEAHPPAARGVKAQLKEVDRLGGMIVRKSQAGGPHKSPPPPSKAGAATGAHGEGRHKAGGHVRSRPQAPHS